MVLVVIDPGGARHEVSLVRVVLRRIRFFMNLAFLATLFFKLFFSSFFICHFYSGKSAVGGGDRGGGIFLSCLTRGIKKSSYFCFGVCVSRQCWRLSASPCRAEEAFFVFVFK